MKSTSLPCVKLTLLVVMVHVAVVVRARPGTRHERQDLRMLPANATGTPQDQALAGGVVLEEAAVLAAQSPVAAPAPAPTQEMASTTASSVKAADVWRKLPSPSGPISHPASPGSGLSMSVGSSGPTSTVGPSATTVATTAATHATTPAHGQDRNKGHSGVASDFAGEDSNIVFPSPPIKIDVGPAPTKFDPFSRAPSGRTPACAKGSTFCTDVDHYPENYLQTMLRSAAVGLGYKEYFGNDVIAESNITQRIDSMDENPLCPYEETVVYPKVAKNKDDKWLYVVNQDHYVQGVRIETCLNTGTACQLAENFPYGYTTSCRQKYILRKLVALNPEGQTSTDMFRLPSCCSCYVTRSSVSSRRSNMTPAITKSGSRKR